jgi:ATP-dependent helicase/nuclease subunit A
MSVVVKKRSPNEEQQKAIFHNGGKLLSAGAGSGKTFVLVEHIVHLLTEVKEKSSKDEWNTAITSKLSSTVLMTFTKKAAGEMSVRMMKKVEELQLDSDSEFWSAVAKNLSSLNITTIHGFCHRLLRMGFWSAFPQDIDLVSSIEHKDKIQKLFDQWFELKKDQLEPLFLANTNALLKAMIEIFSSPELRVMWNSPSLSKTADEEIDKFFNDLLKMKSYQQIFDEGVDLRVNPKDEKKKWYEFLLQINEILTANGPLNRSNYLVYNEFFKTIKRFPPEPKEGTQEQRENFSQLKELRDDLKVFEVELQPLQNHFDVYQKWVTTIHELFQFIESHYFTIKGFSFADLEYFVLKALEVPEVAEKVRANFKYYIVDEFQDTSFIQFSILKSLIGNDKERLFCVGDKKQAIYGFRGGELQVFSDCAQLLGQENNYFLKNNFRSKSKVIEYNNQLFDLVFPLGVEFEGHDPHSVPMEKQNIPEGAEESGSVVNLKTRALGDTKEADLDSLEAKILFDHIKELLAQDEFESICVLYRKLSPSSYLIEHMLKENVPFSAQMKIQFSEDPLINVFVLLVEMTLNTHNAKKLSSSKLLLNTLMRVLDVEQLNESYVDQFFKDIKLLGLRVSFHKFIFSLGISNSFHVQNAELIDAICRLTKEDLKKVYHILKNEESEDYSCEMMSGTGSKRITIMSAHASKGLEFDAVLLGGVHGNGRYMGMRDLIGKWPHSFRWKKSFDQKAYFKSPFYLLEQEMVKLKDFSESKRLLYVACTRAVKHLAYVDLNSEEKELISNKNSWIKALRLLETEIAEKNVVVETEKKITLPLLQQDSLGLKLQGNSPALGIISELSVTRLATLADCPFKFYLQNICKIDEVVENSFTQFDEEEVFYSSKKRGTEIHSLLSKMFLKQISSDQLPIKEKEKILWAYDTAGDFLEKSEVISEELIKFSIFGQMISGTPDIVFTNENELVIWDFKTGIRNEADEASYWFQLASYGHAYSRILKYDQYKTVVLSLLYVDQKNIVTKKFSVDEINQLLFSYWKKTNSLDQINPSHCPNCNYQKLCTKGKVQPL